MTKLTMLSECGGPEPGIRRQSLDQSRAVVLAAPARTVVGLHLGSTSRDDLPHFSGVQAGLLVIRHFPDPVEINPALVLWRKAASLHFIYK